MGCGSSKATQVATAPAPSAAPESQEKKEQAQAKEAVSTEAAAASKTSAPAAAESKPQTTAAPATTSTSTTDPAADKPPAPAPTPAPATAPSEAKRASNASVTTSATTSAKPTDATPKRAEAFEIAEGTPSSASRRLPPLRLSKGSVDEKPKVTAEDLAAKQKAAEERRLAAQQQKRTPSRPGSRQGERTPTRPSSRQGPEDISRKVEDDLFAAEQRRLEKQRESQEKLRAREEHAAVVRGRAARHKQALADAAQFEVGGENDAAQGDESAASSEAGDKVNTWDVAEDSAPVPADAQDDTTLF